MTETVQFAEPPQQPLKPKNRRRVYFWRRFLFGVLVVLVLGTAAFFGYTGMSLKTALSMAKLGTTWVSHKVRPVPPFGGKKQVNILVLGVDVSPDGTGLSRTDTMKLVRVDLEKSRISVLSIPRDTWVELPDGTHGRINGAYMMGGPLLKNELNRVGMAKTAVAGLLQDITGEEITFDHYVRIRTDLFVNLVDALGGVRVNVAKDMDYEDPSQQLFIHLKKGDNQLLNGKEAEGFVRFRHDKYGDYGRIKRQDEFLHALIARVNEPGSKARLLKLIEPMRRILGTDIPDADLIALKDLVGVIGMANVQTATLPTKPCEEGRASVVKVEDRVAAAQTISEVLHGPRPTVVVLNGSGRNGLAREVSELIGTTDFNVVALGTVREHIATSEILATDRCKTEAATLADKLGVQEVDTESVPPAADYGKKVSTPPTAQITVVLGEDYTGIPERSARASAL